MDSPTFSFGWRGTVVPSFSRKETEGLMTSSSPLGVGISLQSSQAGSGMGCGWTQLSPLGMVLVSFLELRPHHEPGEEATVAHRAEGLGQQQAKVHNS